MRRPSPVEVMTATDGLQDLSARLLTDAVAAILQRIRDADDVRELIDAYSASFSDYVPGGEHRLEWTRIHHEFCDIVEGHLKVELQVLGCSEEALLEHAMCTDDPVAERLLTRLLAKTDYELFCVMMNAESSPEAFARRWLDDDDDEYLEVEVDYGNEEAESEADEADLIDDFDTLGR